MLQFTSFAKHLISTHLDWPIAKKIQVHVLPEKVALGMRRVKLFASHEEVTSKIVPWREKGEKEERGGGG